MRPYPRSLFHDWPNRHCPEKTNATLSYGSQSERRAFFFGVSTGYKGDPLARDDSVRIGLRDLVRPDHWH